WLASLGYLPAVRHVTVTIDTAPEPGSTLADSVAAALDPAAPLTARQIMGQLVDAAPAAAADGDTRVSITFDPAARGEVNRLLVQAGDGRPVPGLSWSEAGPVGAEEEPGCYRHDSGISLSWSWAEAPRPRDAEATPARSPAVYKRRTGRDETARDSYDQPRARQAAAEEAAGAGLWLVSLYGTVTVTSAAELPRAAAETEAAAESSRIRLRRMTYAQAAGGAATLLYGISPAELARRMPH